MKKYDILWEKKIKKLSEKKNRNAKIKIMVHYVDLYNEKKKNISNI